MMSGVRCLLRRVIISVKCMRCWPLWQDLTGLSEVAESNLQNLGGEVLKLNVHFRRRMVAMCGGILHMVAILLTFFAAVVFMRLAPRRFALLDLVRT